MTGQITALVEQYGRHTDHANRLYIAAGTKTAFEKPLDDIADRHVAKASIALNAALRQTPTTAGECLALARLLIDQMDCPSDPHRGGHFDFRLAHSLVLGLEWVASEGGPS